MNNKLQELRRAGWLYLALAVIAPFSLTYVPGKIEQATGSMALIIGQHAQLLSLSMASEMVYQIIEVFLVLALFSYFRDLNAKLARQMLVLGLLPLPIVFLNELNLVGAIILATADSRVPATGADAPDFVAAFLYALHGKGLILASVFWGLWLVPLGRLVLRSGVMPKVFAYLVLVAAAGYVLRALAVLIFPAFVSTRIVESLTLTASIMMIGEVPIIAGLLWAGSTRKKLFARGE